LGNRLTNFAGKEKYTSTRECKRTLTYGSGTVIVAEPDGRVTGTLADGSKFTVETNCRITIDFPNPPPDGTTLTLNPDGSQNTRSDHASTSTNGTTTTNADGSTTTTYPDGTSVTNVNLNPGTWKDIKFPECYGIKRIVKLNGRMHHVKLEDGTSINWRPTGEKSTWFGSRMITKNPDGSTEVEDFPID